MRRIWIFIDTFFHSCRHLPVDWEAKLCLYQLLHAHYWHRQHLPLLLFRIGTLEPENPDSDTEARFCWLNWLSCLPQTPFPGQAENPVPGVASLCLSPRRSCHFRYGWHWQGGAFTAPVWFMEENNLKIKKWFIKKPRGTIMAELWLILFPPVQMFRCWLIRLFTCF